MLEDCTEVLGDMVENPAKSTSPQERRAVLVAATKWATQNKYFPCEEYAMCGVVYNHGAKASSVYIRTAPIGGVPELAISPEASVSFALPSFRVTGNMQWHHGCRR